MNETLSDPTLRSFRQPITIRLRTKIDELTDVRDAQARQIAKQGREIASLKKELRKVNRELKNAAVDVLRLRAQLRHVIDPEKGGGADISVSDAA